MGKIIKLHHLYNGEPFIVNSSKITFVQIMDGCTTVYLLDGYEMTVKETMEEIEEMLKENENEKL